MRVRHAGHAAERVPAGHLLGDDPGAPRFKAATSTLYRETAARQRLALDGRTVKSVSSRAC
ncbi:hypothetical protein [Lentzea waywayandensis]|uniref:hypothetical protein n=1 Tax=Lentzea waywayandensis TaxID=84724 RepID=UPI0015A6EE0C|nr:hypothetical protein [Lentzea waywayandensis]